MSIDYMLEILPSLLSKIPLVISVFLLSALVSQVLAVILVVIRECRIPLLSQLIFVFISFARSVPGLIHIFIVYYGLPLLLLRFGIDINHWSRFAFSVIALSIHQGVTVSEIIRPAYEAIPIEQFEAGKSIGMTTGQIIKRIIVPQMYPIMLPSLGNASIDLFKYTSLLFLIGLADIMGQAEIFVANSYGIYQLEVYFIVALIYWFFSWGVGQLFKSLEQSSRRFLAS